MELKPARGTRVFVHAQREAVFGDEGVSVHRVSLDDGNKAGIMTGSTLAGFCEVEMPHLDGRKHWYPIGELSGEQGEIFIEDEIPLEELEAEGPDAESA